MNLKSLLLGSAAAVMVVGGAQAADLSVAEPVDYVRVCDAFGVGYWYIPGTDTCIKIGGHVEVTTFFGDSRPVNYAIVDGEDGDEIVTHNSNWNFRTEASVNFTAKSMTEYGELTGFVDVRGRFENNRADNFDGDTNNYSGAYINEAWLSLGPLLAGHTTSTFDYEGGFSDPVFRSDIKTDQVRLSWAMSGFGIMLGVEDPNDRWGTNLSSSFNMPDLIAAVTASQANWDGKLAVGFSDLGADPVTGWGGGTVWGIHGGVTIGLDAIAPGDKLRIAGAYGTGNSYVGYGVNGANNWSVFASFQHFWSPTLSSAITGSYASTDFGPGADVWGVGANLVWAPVSGFSAKLEGIYETETISGNPSVDSWTAKVALKRSW